MFDFLKITKTWDKGKQCYIYAPQFVIKTKFKDLMIRQKDFYAIFNEESGLWEQDEATAIHLIDAQVKEYAYNDAGASMEDSEHGPRIKFISDTSNRLIATWHTFCQKDLRDTWNPLNQRVIFSNQTPVRNDYASKKLDYPLEESPTPAYDECSDIWYLPDEKQKWEWFTGCALSGDARKIQKAIIFYGEPGTGKSSIAERFLGDGVFGGKSMYAGSFDATALAESKDSFGTDFLEEDPIVAIDGEAKMSVMNAKGTFNKIISHERVRVNAKFKATFYTSPNCLLMMCANDPVQISPNSGLRRRIIDIQPTGNLLSPDRYDWCMSQIQFERSGVAYKCIETYKRLGPHFYDSYISEDMMNRTSPFQNYVAENYLALKDGISLAAAYKLYTEYAEISNFKNVLPRYKFRDTLKLYFDSYEPMPKCFFSGFKYKMVGMEDPNKPKEEETEEVNDGWLEFNETHSLLDDIFKDCPAQYETDDKNHPLQSSWDKCKTTLKDLDTTKTHYVRPIDNTYITIDFDIKGETGEKDYEANLKAANSFPPTYAELSKSGSGIHLEYIYKGGDPEELSAIFGPNIEVKVFKGKEALRRKLTKCNNLPIAVLTSGLPIKEVKKVINEAAFKSEAKLRNCIKKAVKKEFETMPSTKQNIMYINYILKEAYESGKSYDVRDLMTPVRRFAMHSTNNKDFCMDLYNRMLWCSKDILEADTAPVDEYVEERDDNKPIVFFDCEIFPSYDQSVNIGIDLTDSKIPKNTPALFVLCWKLQGENHKVNTMINPSADEVRKLFSTYKMVGFNNRNYDNHICAYAMNGATPEEIYILNTKLINPDKEVERRARIGWAYNISYTDIYDLASNPNKFGLKLWEIKLINKGKLQKHIEWDQPWDHPVAKKDWERVAEYCGNDVLATEAVYNEINGDVTAREILAELAKPYGGTMNTTTNNLTCMIVFEGNKNPGLIYTDFTTGKQYGPHEDFKVPILNWDEYVALGDDWTGVKPKNTNHFPGYHLVRDDKGKLHNMYRGVDVGMGGYVYANPGMYGRAMTKDVASEHPHSIKALNLFGDYTSRYVDILDTRIDIKHKDYDKAKSLWDGALSPYLNDPKIAKKLSNALKTALNSAYGITYASFPNPMKDPRNINNIVALRGALFMKTLQDEVEAKGYKVIHIKTDSIKVADPDDKILKFIDDFGKKYGYDFEVEHTWERLCLINDAVYIGRHDLDDPDYVSDKETSEKDYPNRWEATGDEFKVPYVFKSLFSHQPIEFLDKTFIVQVKKGALYLVDDEKKHKNFVGRVSQFSPMTEHGLNLYCLRDNKFSSPGGTKGYKWMESYDVENRQLEDKIDETYFKKKCDDAIKDIEKFGDYHIFTSTD